MKRAVSNVSWGQRVQGHVLCVTKKVIVKPRSSIMTCRRSRTGFHFFSERRSSSVMAIFAGEKFSLHVRSQFRAGINVEKGHQDVSRALHPLPVQEAGYRCLFISAVTRVVQSTNPQERPRASISVLNVVSRSNHVEVSKSMSSKYPQKRIIRNAVQS